MAGHVGTQLNLKNMIHIQSTITKLDAHIKNRRASYYADLNLGLSVSEIQQLESTFKTRLPKALKILYQWKNGQQEENAEAFINNAMFLSLQEALETAAELTGMIDTDFEIANWWHMGWIPIFHNGAGSYLCYDTFGVFTGKRGQILEFWKEDPDRNVVAPSLGSLLNSLIRLYAGENALDEFLKVKFSRNYPKRFSVA